MADYAPLQIGGSMSLQPLLSNAQGDLVQVPWHDQA